jgi:hypothetical protein
VDDAQVEIDLRHVDALAERVAVGLDDLVTGI